MMSKKNITIVVGLVLIIAVVGVLKYKRIRESNVYSVVYMTTGEVYAGKLTTFPDFNLRDGYILQVVKDQTDQNKSNFQLQPVNEALWAPKSMHLIKDNIVFYGQLSPTSKIAETIAGQGK